MKKWILKPYVMKVDLSIPYMENRLADLFIYEQGRGETLEVVFPLIDGWVKERELDDPHDRRNWEKWSRGMDLEEKNTFFLDATMSVTIQAISLYLYRYRPLPKAGRQYMLSWIKTMEDKNRPEEEIARKLGLNAEAFKKFKTSREGFGVWVADAFFSEVKPKLDYRDLIDGFETLEALPKPSAAMAQIVHEIATMRVYNLKKPVGTDFLNGYLKAARQVVESYSNQMGRITAANEQLFDCVIKQNDKLKEFRKG